MAGRAETGDLFSVRHGPTGTALAALCLLAVWLAPPARAQHAAHEHGVSRLNLAVEGAEMLIEFIAPGADIVGFEHPAKTAEDKAAVEKALAVLRDGAALIAAPAEAGCRLIEAEAEAEAEHPAEGHGKSQSQAQGKEAHAEFHVRYRFACDTPDRLTRIDVRLFDRFPNMREIEAQAVTPKGQRAAELTPGAARLTF